MRQIDELRKAVRLLMQIGYPRRGTVEESQTLQDFADLIQREWSAERLGELLANLSGGGKSLPVVPTLGENSTKSGYADASISAPPAQNLSPAQGKLCEEWAKKEAWCVPVFLRQFLREALALREPAPQQWQSADESRAQDLIRLQRDNAELRRKLDASL
jgi:hypothetical protein